MKKRRKKNRFKKLKQWLDKIGTLNIVLICVGIFFIWFNCQMFELFKVYGTIPETYACTVVGATIGECGICGWIKVNKEKKQSRQWDKEDRKENNYNNYEGM